MSDGRRCPCGRCTISGMMGPVILITVGTLFLVGRMDWGYSFHETWPVIIIVIGLVKLAEAMAPTTGHLAP